MFDRLEQLEERFMELEREMSDPGIVSDQPRMQKVGKQHRDMQPVIERYREYKQVRDGRRGGKGHAGRDDEDMRAMAQEELASLEPRLAEIDEALKMLLLPKDPNDDKNMVLELRAATGGDEAALFVAEVFRMYLRFAEQHRWKVEVLSSPSARWAA